MVFTIFVTRNIPGEGIEMLKRNKMFKVRVSTYNGILPRRALLKAVKGCHAVLALLTDRIDEAFFKAAGPQLKIVANYAVGFDNIDVKAAAAHNVVVTNTPGVLTNAVAEFTVAALMALSKHLEGADLFTRSGKYKGWDPNLFLGDELQGKTIGIVGLGRIGYKVAHTMGAGFGMKIIYNDPRINKDFEKKYGAQFMKLPALLKQADYVTLHVPLLPSTHHLISTKEFNVMKKTAYLINTARGPVVDEKALTRALKNRRIAGAALDVFECEPAIDCDMTDTLELKKLDNVILTPHIASATREARNEMSLIVARNIIAVLSGKKPLTPAQ
ncbi:MAG TPA: D-glycerate dehydrogenase [Candidatus Magasanikbacteria bacterium]|nr:D-glycerate dehydrogenase [Candidatus Magasanikbacteria bacterium]